MNRAGVVIFVAALCAGAAGPARAAEFSRVEGTELGPSLESVTAILQDRGGFLWIGSREGLALFDGYSAVMFEHDVSNPDSISDNNIRTVYEDASGTIWVGTNTGGLERLDRRTWTFAHHRHDSQDPGSLPHDSVYAVVEAPDGRFWVGTQGGLARFDPEASEFERFPAGPDGPAANYVASLRLEPDGTLWIGTANSGLSRRDATTGRFKTYRHDPADPSSLCGNGVYTLAEDRRGRLWLGTDGGPCWWDRATDSFRQVPLASGARKVDPIVTSMAVDAAGDVWASTLQSGLWRLEPGGEEETFRRKPFRTSRSSDSEARVVASLADRAGNLWLGTWSEGLGRVSPRNRAFAEPPAAAASEEISSVLVDRRGDLWVGLLSSDLLHVPAHGAPRRLPLGNTALSMIDAGDALWIGSTSGLFALDRSSRTIRRYVHDPDDPASVGAGWAWAVTRDRNGDLWVGTGEGGLQRLRPDGKFESFRHDPDDPASLSDDYVTACEEDRDEVLWVGTRSGGLNAFDRQSRRFRRYFPEPGNERALSHHSVSALLVDRSGTLWVGTAGGGLNRGERDASGTVVSFRHFGEDDGLISNNVVGLQEDDDGTIWVGTRRGLSRLDPEFRRFVNYGTEDGLASAEFSLGSPAEGRDAFYFGTHRGVVAVRRGTPFPELRDSPTVVSAIRTIGGLQPTERPAPVDLAVTIPWGEIVSVDFAVLDYGERRRHRYGYRISGRQSDWVDLGSRHEITFTDLDPGRYELSVRGRNDQGVWSEAASPLRIQVVPPFWMTDWFRFLAAALVVGAAVGGHQIRMSRLARRNRELENLKNQRELALEEARTSQEALHGAYDRLRRLTRRLEAAKEDERRHIARELHDEMGQALTTAKLNLQLLAGSSNPEDRERRVADTLSLLDRMIGHVRALSLDLRPPLLDELGLSAALRGYVEALSKRSGVAVELRMNPIPPKIPTEIEIAAFRVVQESLTNVLRHAGAGRIHVDVRYDPAGFDLQITDDGRGFDVNAALERALSGAHVGLLGMRERVESMGGSMVIESAPGSGATICARIPLQT